MSEYFQKAIEHLPQLGGAAFGIIVLWLALKPASKKKSKDPAVDVEKKGPDSGPSSK